MSNRATRSRTAFFVALAIALGMIPGSAARSYASDVSEILRPSGTRLKKKCLKDKIYSDSLRECVIKTSKVLTDFDFYYGGYELLKSKKYEEALDTFDLIKNKEWPQVFTFIGITKQKLGKVDESVSLFVKALSLDPNYIVAREHLGEAYLQKGEPEKARDQLVQIEKLCGVKCDAYYRLEKSIGNYSKS
jgi:tetratricopeptide (TPR) repeat protein